MDLEVLDEFVAEGRAEMPFIRRALIRAGRGGDVEKLQERLMSDGTFMDSGSYDRTCGPVIWKYLDN